jgi:hypothetical protein
MQVPVSVYGKTKLFSARKQHDGFTVTTYRRGEWEEHFRDLAKSLRKWCLFTRTPLFPVTC